MALKKSNKLSLEEATRLAILGKLPLTESTTVTTDDNLTMVETDDANIVIEPKDNAAVDVGNPVEDVCTEPVCDEPVSAEPEGAELPVEVPEEAPVEDVEETEVDEFDESKKFEGKKVVNRKKLEKKEVKKEHKIAVKENRLRSKKVETIVAKELTYIDDMSDLRQFCWGDAAKSTLDIVEEHDKEDELFDYLESFGYDEDNPIGATELNDIIAYDDYLLDEIGIDLEESKKVENKEVKTEGEAPLYKKRINKVDIKKVENKEVKIEGEAPLFKKRINKVDIKKQENKEVKTEGEAPLFKKRINKVDIKKQESKKVTEGEDELSKLQDEIRGVDVSKLSDKEYAEFKKKADRVHELINKTYDTKKLSEAPKKHIINTVDLRKTEAKKDDLNDKLKTRVAEGLTKFVKEAYVNGKEVKVEKVLKLTENKLYVKGKLIMEHSTRDFSCKLVPMQENKTFRKYTINENKTLKITEGKTAKGKSFSIVIKK